MERMIVLDSWDIDCSGDDCEGQESPLTPAEKHDLIPDLMVQHRDMLQQYFGHGVPRLGGDDDDSMAELIPQ